MFELICNIAAVFSCGIVFLFVMAPYLPDWMHF